MTREVWFQLVDGATRDAVTGTSAHAVDLPMTANSVRHLRDAVFEKVSRALPANVIASNLRVYADRAAYVEKQHLLKASASLIEYGKDEDHALIVEVPQRQTAKKHSYDEVSEQWLEKTPRVVCPCHCVA